MRWAGLIGGEILRRFTVTVDHRHRALYLRPNAAFDEPFEATLSGLVLATTGEAFDRLEVHQVIAGSPAREAGLEPGDRIIAADGTPIVELTVRGLRDRLRGPPGESIRLEIERAGQIRQVQLTLRRQI